MIKALEFAAEALEADQALTEKEASTIVDTYTEI